MSDSRKNERLLLAAVFLFWFSVYTYPSFLTDYVVNTLGATKVLAGTIVGSYGFTQMALRIPLGIISDVVKKRKLFVMLGFGMSILASAGFVLVAQMTGANMPGWLPYAALIFRGMAGMTAATWVNFSVLYSASYKAEDIPAAMSRIVVPQCGSQVVAMLLGAQLAGYLGETYAFLLATLGGLMGLIVMSRVKEQPPVGDPMTIRGLIEVAKDRDLILGTALATIYQLVAWATVQGFVQNWAREVICLTTAELGYLSVANLLPTTLISRLSGDILTRKFGRRTVLASGFVCMAIACCLYPLTNSLFTLILVQALFGCGVGLIMPLTMACAIQNIPDAIRGAAMGIYQAVYGLGMFLGPVIAGAVIDAFSVTTPGNSAGAVPGYVANFIVAAAIALAGGIVAVVLTRKAAKK